eukprot:SAG11_NODE_2228_length_3654_cov_1.962640_6_plen_56_part_00
MSKSKERNFSYSLGIGSMRGVRYLGYRGAVISLALQSSPRILVPKGRVSVVIKQY